MATIPLNTFKTVTADLTTATANVYTAPNGVTSIVLMAQVTNVTSSTANTTVSHVESTGSISTELVKDFDIPGNDAAGVVTGKLVIETGDKISASAGANSALKLTLSILETAND